MARKEQKKDQAEQEQPLVRRCGAMEVHERLLRTVPGYQEARSRSEDHALRAARAPWLERTGCTTIPVVVHVVYKTSAQNISDAQVHSQIDVLNADFRKKNADVSTVPAPFAPLADDARVQFELASTDPEGNPTDGIVRKETGEDSFASSDDGIKFDASGGSDAWPSDRYLNIWVGPRILSSSGQSLLGYAQFPGGPADTDGVVILHSAFGTTGTAAAPFDLGRTTTHEVGHWLNLRHIWGDDGTGCSGSDFVADTPNQGGPNFGTPSFPTISCSNGPNGDMFMNYMDYVDDAAMVMFSAGQVTRMQATLDGFRSSIGTTKPCAKPLPKDLPKDLPKEFPKDPPKEFPKDLPKEFPKDLPKDPPKEFPKDPPKELPKDPPKEWPKDPPKEWPKDPPKEWPKDPPKELPKDPPKEWPKDPPKEFPKDLHKDWPKDPPKGLFEPPKGLLEPPKGLFEPPKGLLEPPKGFDPPIDPGGPFPGGPFPGGIPGGGIPFVLATPAATGYGWQADQRQQTAALAAGYLQLLAHYAQLYSHGMLDAAGLAAWREAAAAYQRLVSGSGSSGGA